MIVSILSDKFPSPQHCNMYSPETRGEGEEASDNGELRSVNKLQMFLSNFLKLIHDFSFLMMIVCSLCL